jgi:tetratricopeptide (TPR) repeat protein
MDATDASESVDFFISYTQHDRAWARWIAWILQAGGYRTRLQDRDFRPGDDFVYQMEKALSEAKRLVAVLSPAYLDSRFGQAEWRPVFAKDPDGRRRLLVQVRVTACEPPELLRSRIYIDLVDVNEPTARHLLLDGVRPDEAEATRPPFPGTALTDEHAPRFPTALPPVWNVPHLRNANFTGRTKVLTELTRTLRGGSRVALTGIAGIGKTQTALEYAYQHQSDYELIWWVVADSSTRLHGDLAALADPLTLPERLLAEQDLIVGSVRRWLEQHAGWLLVFDNVEDPAVVAAVLPRGGGGHVLTTSRRIDWAGIAHPVPLDMFRPSEAVKFVVDRTSSRGRADTAAAKQVAETLGYLPLALAQASAYIAETGTLTLRSYGHAFTTRSQELLERGQLHDYEHTVATTWNLTLDQLHERAPAASDLLTLAAFLSPDDIPIALVADHPDVLPEALAQIADDRLRLVDTVGVLRRFSLANTSEYRLTVHPLLQTVIRGNLDPDARRDWAEVAIDLLKAGFPDHGEDPENWPLGKQLLPHAVAAAERAIQQQVAPAKAAWVLDRAARYLAGRAQYRWAQRLLQQALGLVRTAGKSTDSELAMVHNDLGVVLRARGDFRGAREQFEKAVAIGKAASGPAPRDLATWLSNLGLLLRDLGDLAGAKAHVEQALAISVATLGPTHSVTATRRSNFGIVLLALGDLNGAKVQYERALAIGEAALGPTHPTVATWRNNLARVLGELGDLDGAKAQYERALAISETALGPDHPNMAIWRHNLGSVLQDFGDLDGAKAQYERALAISETALGSAHPDMATYRSSLGGVLRDLGDLEGAKDQFEQALAISEAVHGSNHPTMVMQRSDLAHVLHRLGNVPGARAQLRRALTIAKKALGPVHPTTIRIRRQLSKIR